MIITESIIEMQLSVKKYHVPPSEICLALHFAVAKCLCHSMLHRLKLIRGRRLQFWKASRGTVLKQVMERGEEGLRAQTVISKCLLNHPLMFKGERDFIPGARDNLKIRS